MHIKISSSDIPTNSCNIHEMYDCEYMTLKEIDNLFDYWQHHRYIHLKEKKPVLLEAYIDLNTFFFRKILQNNLSVNLFVFMATHEERNLYLKRSLVMKLNMIMIKSELWLPNPSALAIATLLSFKILWVNFLSHFSNVWNLLKVLLPRTILIHYSSMPKDPPKLDYSRKKPKQEVWRHEIASGWKL